MHWFHLKTCSTIASHGSSLLTFAWGHILGHFVSWGILVLTPDARAARRCEEDVNSLQVPSINFPTAKIVAFQCLQEMQAAPRHHCSHHHWHQLILPLPQHSLFHWKIDPRHRKKMEKPWEAKGIHQENPGYTPGSYLLCPGHQQLIYCLVPQKVISKIQFSNRTQFNILLVKCCGVYKLNIHPERKYDAFINLL